MSSGFVSGGTADAPIERSDEWKAAQEELEANRRRKAAEAQQSDGRSLFETLQANKAAKEEAFAESAKLKNQFRSLDDDEIDFLDSVLESTRAEENRVKKETAEGIAAFRKQQQEADKKAREGTEGTTSEASPTEEQDEWTAGGARKRKRTKDKEILKGVKLRKSSTSERATTEEQSDQTTGTTKATASETKPPVCSTKPVAAVTVSPKTPAPLPKSGSVLVAYGSDSDDD